MQSNKARTTTTQGCNKLPLLKKFQRNIATTTMTTTVAAKNNRMMLKILNFTQNVAKSFDGINHQQQQQQQ